MIDPEKVRQARERAKLTQEQAAKAAGLANRQSWNSVERGRTNITLATLDRIAKVLGVRARDLIE